MTPAAARQALRYLARRRAPQRTDRHAELRAALRTGLFPQQLAMAFSAAPKVVARCGRRAGKSTAAAPAAVDAVLSAPGNRVAYVALTRSNARDIMLPELERLQAQHGFALTVNRSDLNVQVGGEGGGTIMLRGADNERSVDKLRSFHFELIILDEMAFYGAHVVRLIDSLEATLMDRRGRIMALSSPGYVRAGRFWEMDQPGSGWERHHWTALDNPHIPHAAQWLAELRAQRAWAADDPTYLREYLGQWVDDARSLCFPFNPAVNLYQELPELPWSHVLGIDVGYDPDPSAFVVLAWSPASDAVYVVHAERRERWLPTEVWARAEALQRQYGCVSIAVDGTKGQVAELAQRFAVPVNLPRQKADKALHIAHIADDLRHGRLRLLAAHDGLINEMRTVAWDEQRRGPDPRVPNDLTDALQYAWCESGHFAARPAPRLDRAQRQAEEEAALEAAAARAAAEDAAADDEADDLGAWRDF